MQDTDPTVLTDLIVRILPEATEVIGTMEATAVTKAIKVIHRTQIQGLTPIRCIAQREMSPTVRLPQIKFRAFQRHRYL